MSWFMAVILGLVQGLTEFLPVSSSGHLALTMHYWDPGFSEEENVAFMVLLHVGTLLAVALMYWKSIWWILREKRRLIWIFIVGTIPAAVIGILFKKQFELVGRYPELVGCCFLFTAIVLAVSQRRSSGGKTLGDVSFINAIVIGLFQALAILPGMSRSGSTIAAGLFSRFQFQTAATFSFLLSIPAIGGAALLEGRHINDIGMRVGYLPLVLGFAASVLSGMLAIWVVQKTLKFRKLHYFAAYLAVLGVAVLIYELWEPVSNWLS